MPFYSPTNSVGALKNLLLLINDYNACKSSACVMPIDFLAGRSCSPRGFSATFTFL